MDRRFNLPNRYSSGNYEGEYPPPYNLPSPSYERDALPPPQPEEQKEERATMNSWLQRATSSKEFQFGATALVSGAVVAGAILGYQHVRRQEKVEDLKSSIPALGGGHVADRVCYTFNHFDLIRGMRSPGRRRDTGLGKRGKGRTTRGNWAGEERTWVWIWEHTS